MTAIGNALSAWFAPPRPHGEALAERRVGFVELFFDLVFVVLVSQIGHEIATHPSWEGVWVYAVLFALVWFAWLNGTQYEDLHGRGDGRSRIYIFIQMGFLAMLAVNAAEAATDPTAGAYFAFTYAALMGFLCLQWAMVLKVDDPQFRSLVIRYVGIMLVLAATIAATAWLSDPHLRLVVWTVAVLAALFGNVLIFLRAPVGPGTGAEAEVTESGAERFGLYIIIVLGESVLGVVNGLAAADRSWLTVWTGIMALALGAGMWWTYFDFAGMRIAKGRGARTRWYFLHLPLSGGIAAVGAAMVGLVSHANEAHTSAEVAWLMGGSLAVVQLCLALLMLTLPQWPGERPIPFALLGSAGYSLIIAWIAPTPWLLALLLLVGMTLVWGFAFIRAAERGRLITGVPLDSALPE